LEISNEAQLLTFIQHLQNGMSSFLKATKMKAQPSWYCKMGNSGASWTKCQHKAENEKRRKAYWAEGYPDIMSFFGQEQAKSTMTHMTALDIWSWVHMSQLGKMWLQDEATMVVMEEEEEDVDAEVEMGMIGSGLRPCQMWQQERVAATEMAKVGSELGSELGGNLGNDLGGELGNDLGMVGSRVCPCQTWV